MSTVQAMQDHTATKRNNAAPSAFASNLGRILGAIGIVLLISTPLTYFLTLDFGPLIWGKLLVGALFVGAYLATNASFFARLAGARSTGLLAISGATVAIAFGLVGVLNFVAYKNPKEFDFTHEGLYTLSQQTTALLGRLKSDVTIQAFYANYDPAYPEVQELLKRYAGHGAHLATAIIDPQSRPDLVEKLQITDRGPRIVVTSGSQEARAKEPSEQELTNAIIRVAEQTEKTVYFLTGHGEADITDGEQAEGYKTIADAIASEGYTVKPLSLIESDQAVAMGMAVKLGAEATDAGAPQAEDTAEADKDKGKAAQKDDEGLAIPANAAVVWVAGARSKLFAPEVKALETYLNKGGRVIVALDPDVDVGLSGLLKQWKIDVHDDLVVDTNPLGRLLGLGPAAPMIQPSSTEHAITRDLTAPGVMMTTRSLAIVAGGEAGVDAQGLAGAGSTAWGETNLNAADGSAERDTADHLGPVDVLAVASKAVAGLDANKLTDEGRLIVVGDSDWLSNRYLPMQGNRDLALNAVNWMAEQEEKITIRPKQRQASQLFLSGEQLGLLKFFSMDILPVMMVAFGLAVVLIRRQK